MELIDHEGGGGGGDIVNSVCVFFYSEVLSYRLSLLLGRAGRQVAILWIHICHYWNYMKIQSECDRF